MRLIDADALKEGLKEKMYGHPFERTFLSGVVDSEPTIDAIHVVRCRECVNCLIDNTERKYHLCMRHSSVFPRKVELDDFCSYGERKEGAD